MASRADVPREQEALAQDEERRSARSLMATDARGQDGIDFSDAFKGSILYLSPAVLLAHIQIHSSGGAQLWFSRRQAISQRQERLLDHDGLERSGGDERLSYRRRTSHSHAQAAQLVQRGCCCPLDPGILGNPSLARGTSTHGRRRETIQSKSSFAKSAVESHSTAGAEPH